MSVTHRSDSSVNYGSRTNTTITAPTGITNGDTLTIGFAIGSTGTPPTPTPPAGFNILPGYPTIMSDVSIVAPGDFKVLVYVWGKIASGEAGDYTITHASANTTAYMSCDEGADTANPYNPNPSITVQTNSPANPATTGGVTTVNDGSLVIWLLVAWDFFVAPTPPAGATPTFTERFNGAASIMYAADGVMSPAGATGAKSMNLTASQDDAWSASLIVINAAASSGGGGRNSRIIMIHNGGIK